MTDDEIKKEIMQTFREHIEGVNVNKLYNDMLQLTEISEMSDGKTPYFSKEQKAYIFAVVEKSFIATYMALADLKERGLI